MLQTQFLRAAEPGSDRLMVMLHGLGDSVAGYYWMPQALRLPWLNFLLVNAPDEYFGGYSWYDFAGDMVPGVRRSYRLLAELLDGLPARGFPAETITFGGFSQGCVMAVEVGCRYPQRLAGIVGISGYVCAPECLVKELSPVAGQQRFLITHGRMDPLLPVGDSRGQFGRLRQAGLNIRWHEFMKDHSIIEEELDAIREFVEAGYAVGG